MEAYRIGVAIAMSSNAGAVLGALQRDLFGLRRDVDLTSEGFGRLKLAAVGAMAAITGAAALRGMWGLVEAGSKLVDQQIRLKMAGADGLEIAQDTATAWKTAGNVLATDVVDNLKVLRELRSQLASAEEARELLPQFQSANAAVQFASGQAGRGHQDNVAQSMLKVMDLRGGIVTTTPNGDRVIDPEKLKTEMDLMVKAIISSQGLLSVTDFLNFAKQAGPAARAMSAETFYKFMPELQVAMGGSRAGTAAMSMFQQMVGGVLTQRTATAMEQYGLLDPSHVHVKRGGQVTVDPGGVRDMSLFMSNPFKWITETVLPRIDAEADRTHRPRGEAEIEAVMRLFGRQTTQREAMEFIQNLPQFHREFQNQEAAQGGNAAYQTAMESPTMRIKAFTTAWENLMTALGVPLVDTATGLLSKMTGVLNDMGQWAAKNPALVGTIEKAAAAMAAVAVVFGTLAVAAAGVMALGALGGMAAMMTALAGATTAAVAGLSSLDKKLHELFPMIYGGTDAGNDASSRARADLKAGRLTVPWYFPGPTPNGATREAFPWGGDAGGNVHKESYAPPAMGARAPIHNIIYMDGRKVAEGVTQHQTRSASRPNSGPTGFDPSVTPLYTSHLVAI